MFISFVFFLKSTREIRCVLFFFVCVGVYVQLQCDWYRGAMHETAIKLDIHNAVESRRVDGDDNSVAFLWSHRQPKKHIKDDDANEYKDEVTIDADDAYVYGGFPFQCWGGRLPVDMVRPLTQCCSYNRSVPCPRDAVSIVSKWNHGEYGNGTCKDTPCVGMPVDAVARRQQHWKALMRHANVLESRGCASFARLLKSPSCQRAIT